MKIARFYITDGTTTWWVDAPWSNRHDVDANAAIEGHTIYHVSFPNIQDCPMPKIKKSLSSKAIHYLQHMV
jgi:hypothetical protein